MQQQSSNDLTTFAQKEWVTLKLESVDLLHILDPKSIPLPPHPFLTAKPRIDLLPETFVTVTHLLGDRRATLKALRRVLLGLGKSIFIYTVQT